MKKHAKPLTKNSLVFSLLFLLYCLMIIYSWWTIRTTWRARIRFVFLLLRLLRILSFFGLSLGLGWWTSATPAATTWWGGARRTWWRATASWTRRRVTTLSSFCHMVSSMMLTLNNSKYYTCGLLLRDGVRLRDLDFDLLCLSTVFLLLERESRRLNKKYKIQNYLLDYLP